jgi:hypothetical protein
MEGMAMKAWRSMTGLAAATACNASSRRRLAGLPVSR